MTETTSPQTTDKLDYQMVARWSAVALIACAVLALELTGHADKGSFIQLIAMPGLVTLGLHTAAKNLN